MKWNEYVATAAETLASLATDHYTTAKARKVASDAVDAVGYWTAETIHAVLTLRHYRGDVTLARADYDAGCKARHRTAQAVTDSKPRTVDAWLLNLWALLNPATHLYSTEAASKARDGWERAATDTLSETARQGRYTVKLPRDAKGNAIFTSVTTARKEAASEIAGPVSEAVKAIGKLRDKRGLTREQALDAVNAVFPAPAPAPRPKRARKPAPEAVRAAEAVEVPAVEVEQ